MPEKKLKGVFGGRLRLLPARGERWKALIRIPLAVGIALFGVFIWVLTWTWMPGQSASAPLSKPTKAELETAEALDRHVTKLAGEIGERNLWANSLPPTVDYLTEELNQSGYTVMNQPFEAYNHKFENLWVEVPGGEKGNEIVVVGAHYDTVRGSPGADDNGSGTAAVLRLAKVFANVSLPRTLRFVFFANEEPPFFKNEGMGSVAYAEECRSRGDDIVAMYSMESMGFFSDEPDSQGYPPPFNFFYPTSGNFIGFIGDRSSAPLVRRSLRTFRESASVPSEGVAAPTWINGVDFSDHWSFIQAGYPGIMVSDSAFFRNEHYHTEGDLPETLDYDRMGRVVVGMESVIRAEATRDL